MGDPANPADPAGHASSTTPADLASNGSEVHAGDKYEVPAYEEHSSYTALKDRIRHHYELASDYYYSLW
jgi:hypothetical protein